MAEAVLDPSIFGQSAIDMLVAVQGLAWQSHKNGFKASAVAVIEIDLIPGRVPERSWRVTGTAVCEGKERER